MKKNIWIVLTTINHPTKAVLEFAEIAIKRGWGFVVVGDTKTPEDWKVDGVDYLSVEKQHELYGEYSLASPVRHYARKNFGYLYAISHGATRIIESDDDNRPYENFGSVLEKGVQGSLVGNAKWVNLYKYFSDELIWPRGLPLDNIHEKGCVLSADINFDCHIQQYLADLDPDVDAIYRLIYKENVIFDKNSKNIILDQESFCPFNSQNTIFYKEAFSLLYLPSHVSFRMTDIWRSFVAQRVMRELNMKLSFHPPSVYQERNTHNLMKDFIDEIPGYINNDAIIGKLSSIEFESGESLLRKSYLALCEIGIVPESEINLIDMWEASLNNIL